MVPVLSLLVPILVSAVLVFIASSIVHMVLPFHRNDLKRVPDQDRLLDAVRQLNIPAGDYAAPYAGSAAGMKDPGFVERMKRGPVLLLNVSPGGPVSMGTPLTLWFLYTVLVGVFAAYLTGRALGPGAHYLEVFRFAGTIAFTGYSLALLQNSIWWRRNWGMTVRGMIDGLVYALLTAGTFGWLWPR